MATQQVPKARSAYILFGISQREKNKAKYATMSQVDIVRNISDEWKVVSVKDKKGFSDKAAQEKKVHDDYLVDNPQAKKERKSKDRSEKVLRALAVKGNLHEEFDELVKRLNKVKVGEKEGTVSEVKLPDAVPAKVTTDASVPKAKAAKGKSPAKAKAAKA